MILYDLSKVKTFTGNQLRHGDFLDAPVVVGKKRNYYRNYVRAETTIHGNFFSRRVAGVFHYNDMLTT